MIKQILTETNLNKMNRRITYKMNDLPSLLFPQLYSIHNTDYGLTFSFKNAKKFWKTTFTMRIRITFTLLPVKSKPWASSDSCVTWTQTLPRWSGTPSSLYHFQWNQTNHFALYQTWMTAWLPSTFSWLPQSSGGHADHRPDVSSN